MMVGNHTWTHPNIAVTPLAQTDLEINTTQRLFEVLTGQVDAPVPAALFRRRRTIDARRGRAAADGPEARLSDRRSADRPRRLEEARPEPDHLAHAQPPAGHRARRPARWCCCTTPAATAAAPSRRLPTLIDALRARGYQAGHHRPAGRHEPGRRHAADLAQLLELFLDRIGFGFFRYINDGHAGAVHHRHRPRRRAPGVPGRARPLAAAPRAVARAAPCSIRTTGR